MYIKPAAQKYNMRTKAITSGYWVDPLCHIVHTDSLLQ